MTVTVRVRTGVIQPEPNSGGAGLEFTTFGCFAAFFGGMVHPGEDK